MSSSKMMKMLQVGMIVADAETAAKKFCELFQIDESAIGLVDMRDNGKVVLNFRGAEIEAYNKVATVQVADTEFEFVQHVAGDINAQKEYFMKHGGSGFQHISIAVENPDTMVEKMVSLGGEIQQSGGKGEWSYTFVDMTAQNGIIYEVYNTGIRDMYLAKQSVSQSTLKDFLQIGIVVPDAIAAAKNFCAVFDIDETEMEIIDSRDTDILTMNFRGNDIAVHLVMVNVKAAGVEFEFIQHVGGDVNSQKEFFDKYGAGLQHICINVDNYDAVTAHMKACGAETLVTGGEGGWSYCYMDMTEPTGLIYEIYNDALRDMKMGLK